MAFREDFSLLLCQLRVNVSPSEHDSLISFQPGSEAPVYLLQDFKHTSEICCRKITEGSGGILVRSKKRFLHKLLFRNLERQPINFEVRGVSLRGTEAD